jgi:hypothetical protein
MSNPPLFHIPISELWEYSRNQSPQNLGTQHWNHLGICDDCVGVLWLCSASRSFEQLKIELRVRCIEGFD